MQDFPDASWDRELAEQIKSGSNGDLTSPIEEFFTLLAICNTVVVSSNQNHVDPVSTSLSDQPIDDNTDGATNQMYSNGKIERKQNSPISRKENPAKSLTYEAESPDEAALVKSASMYGYKLLSRGPDSITIQTPDQDVVKYHLLHVLIFDSTRKRMSVIVRREDDDRVIMYCKGADTAVIPHLSKQSKTKTMRQYDTTDALDGKAAGDVEDVPLVEITETHLNVYAREGLRTLCMARKVILYTIFLQNSSTSTPD